MTVAELMLPKRSSTERDAASASGGRVMPRSTASRMVRPPGCTPQSVMSSVVNGPMTSVPQASSALRDCRGNVPGEKHIEAEAANLPGDQLAGVGNHDSAEAVERETHRFGGEDAGGAAIGEEQEAEHLLEIVGFLQVQRAELEVHHEHARVRFGADDVARGLEAVDGGVAAHEADHGALDRGAEAEMVDDVEVEPRRVQAGAGGDEDMRDGAALCGRDLQVVDERAAHEDGGEALEDLHALRGVGEAAADVDLVRVEPELRRGGPGAGVRRHDGVTVLECRSATTCG